MRVDAHQHVWNLDRVSYPWIPSDDPVLHRNIEAEELEPLIAAAGTDRTVLVQAASSDEETPYLLETADRFPWVGAVVAWVPLTDPEGTGRRLETLSRHPKVRGVRHQIHDEPNPDWVVQDRVVESLKVVAAFGLTFDVVAVWPNHLRHVPTLAERVPDLGLVIDHLAKPPIAGGGLHPWAEELGRAAKASPRVSAKVSGLHTAADPDMRGAKDLEPYVDWAFECFGPDRLMFGSDWPVLNLAGDYARVWRETVAIVGRYGPEAQRAILGGTAARVYRIGPV